MKRRAAIAVVLAVIAAACGTAGLFRQYEYEEEIYLSLDGSATVYVNSSIVALDALRGASLDPNPKASVDRAKVRALYTSPVTHDVRVTTSRRNGRPFVHIRLEADDVRRLREASPFAWSTYRFDAEDRLFIYKQTVNGGAGSKMTFPGWNGRELVDFRLHLPSKIAYHNAGPVNFKRGNILVWEQKLDDRRRGEPLAIEARMETQSILYRTLWLFAASFGAVALVFVIVIGWVLKKRIAAPESSVSN
jgi:hypothetical protein